MTDISAPALEPAGEFRIGRVLSRALTITSRNLVKFAALVAIPLLPTLLFSSRGATSAGAGSSAFLSLFVASILGFLSQAVVIYAAFQDMRGRPVSIGASFSRALSRLLPALGLAIVMGFGIFFGALLLLVPGLILATMWYVALPACMVESTPVFESLSRSSALTKGHRWQIFGMYILVAIITAVVTGVVGGIIGALGGLFVLPVVVFVARVVIGAYGAVLVVVAYHDLRAAKEGVDIDRIAAVFD